LAQARAMPPAAVIEEVRSSGLRGRGGAGFPTWQKWQTVRENAHRGSDARNTGPVYLICNGDEGDPGAFMDRMLLESYPFRVIEGMLIAAHAVGASELIFYIRAEYPLAVQRVTAAIDQCTAAGLLAGLSVRVQQGAGAFVCGEETALIASLEGRRGMPRLRPPYPAQSGLNGRPTLVNNVETLAMLPWIVRHGGREFAAIGTPASKGTKVFALAGKVARGGLVEVPMGVTLGQIVQDIGGGSGAGVSPAVSQPNDAKRQAGAHICQGMRTGLPVGATGGQEDHGQAAHETVGRGQDARDTGFKAVQIGGPSGGCIPAGLAQTPVDYQALVAAGAIMGSGGMVVLDQDDCMVDIARYFLEFTQDQSCGRCTFCRVGTRRMLDILTALCEGRAKHADLMELERLAVLVKQGSLCGLGKTAPNPVLTTLRYFRHEYEEHLQGRCPAGRCKALIRYAIDDRCIGCTLCAQNCPADAIAMRPYRRHEINDALCVRCGTCKAVCPVGAVGVDSVKKPAPEI